MKSKLRLLSELIGVFCLIAIAIKLIPSETPTTDMKFVSQQIQNSQANQVYPGFTLVPQSGTAETLLVNLKGDIVHRWKLDAQRARLLPNCNLLVVHGTKWGTKQEPWKSLGNHVREYDWEGNVVWEYITPDKAHHDVQRLPNGNTLILYRTKVPSHIKQRSRDPIRARATIRTDALYEVTHAGEIVWEWYFYNHFAIDNCGRTPCRILPPTFKVEKSFVDWSHVNTASPLPPNHWHAQGDTRFTPGNLLIIPRNWSTVFIIDKASKEIVWEYTGSYKGGLSGGHEAQMIPKGLPGAGNILIFDNGRERHKGASFVLELNPVSKELVWIYDVGKKFFSRAAGSLQRLPNGNTLISEDVPGRVFEVTPSKEIVWEYKSTTRTCRAQRYDYNYCSRFQDLTQ